MSPGKTVTTLVIGSNAAAREAAIASAVVPAIGAAGTALLLEGLPTGRSPLDELPPAAQVETVRIAPGCLCCTGNLTMRVTLNRILRRRPARLYISLANAEHLERIRGFLVDAPYDEFLDITKDLSV
jgi:hypothetical protein